MAYTMEKMKENLRKIYIDDADLNLTEAENRLLDKVQTLEDLWNFLNYKESIGTWDAEAVFGLTLCLFFEKPDFDPYRSLSGVYAQQRGQMRDPDIYSGHPTSYGTPD